MALSFFSRKSGIFLKGLWVNPWFWSKIVILPQKLFFVFKTPRCIVRDVLNRKRGFLDHKNFILTQLKNCHFSKGVNPWFWSKICIFFKSCFSFQNAQINSLMMFQTGNKAFLDHKNVILSQSKNLHFFKVVNPQFWSKFAFSSKVVFLFKTPR